MSQLILLYGESDTYKTTNCGLFADYQFMRTGKPSLLITADSGFGPMQDQVDRGIVIPWCIGTAVAPPFAALIWASKGFWPRMLDAATGRAKVEKKDDMVPIRVGEFGGIILEGLDRFANLIEKWYQEGSKDRNITAPVKTFNEMGVDFNVADHRSLSFFIQKTTYRYLENFKSLAIDRVLVTTHEAKGVDDVTKKPQPGPGVSGKAITTQVSGWFEFTLHSEAYKARVGTSARMMRRMWFQKHPDADMPTVWWDAKLGCELSATARVLRTWSQGYFPLCINADGDYTSGLYHFLEVVDGGIGSADADELRAMAEQAVAIEPATAEPETKPANGETTGPEGETK